MTLSTDLTKMVPGFDFLQGLMKSGGAGMPGIGQWIAPTLEPEELQRRIDELRTVQFWLEQNAKLIGTTIQALEVQRMTLATLKSMNLPMADLTDALRIGKPKAAAATPATANGAAPAAAASKSARGGKGNAAAGAVSPIDPMQWWGALTKQFTELAAKAMKDGSVEVARNLAGTAVKQGLGSAGDSIERAMTLSSKAAGLAAKAGDALAGSVVKRATGAAAKRRKAAKR